MMLAKMADQLQSIRHCLATFTSGVCDTASLQNWLYNNQCVTAINISLTVCVAGDGN